MTTEEFIKTTQPIVDLVTAMAKIIYGEHSERFIAIMASIMDAQAKGDAETLFDWFDESVLAVDNIGYIIKEKFEHD